MVERLQEVIQQLLEEKKQLTLFAIVKASELSYKWSIIVSASWATRENHFESFDYIKSLLDPRLTKEEKADIARISIYPKSDEAVQALLQFQPGTVIKEDTKVNGFIVHEGYILYANPQG